GATERLPIDDGDAPAGLTASRGHGRGDAGADNDEIVLLVHGVLPFSAAAKLAPACAPPMPRLAHVALLVCPAGHGGPVHKRVRVGGGAERPGRQAPP